jgi:hypothetical protein
MAPPPLPIGIIGMKVGMPNPLLPLVGLGQPHFGQLSLLAKTFLW